LTERRTWSSAWRPRRSSFEKSGLGYQRVPPGYGIVDRVREAAWDRVGEIVDYENTFLLCYVRGPEGLIVELAERLDGAPS
jgi:hypothetical protein